MYVIITKFILFNIEEAYLAAKAVPPLNKAQCILRITKLSNSKNEINVMINE